MTRKVFFPIGNSEMKPSTTKQPSLATRVIELVENARRNVAAVANVAQVYTNYEIGRQIVEEEQGGKHRADYGKRILIDLSNKLTARFGRGWSAENLRKMRSFFLMYSEIHNSVVEIDDAEIHNSVAEIPKFSLSWSHYLKLMRIDDPDERRFYEIEAAENKYRTILPGKAQLKALIMDNGNRKNSTPACP